MVDGLELRITGTAHSRPAFSGVTRRRHSGTVFSMPVAFDLSYLHLRRLPVLRIWRAPLFFGRSRIALGIRLLRRHSQTKACLLVPPQRGGARLPTLTPADGDHEGIVCHARTQPN